MDQLINIALYTVYKIVVGIDYILNTHLTKLSFLKVSDF